MINKILFGSCANLVAILTVALTALAQSALAVRYLASAESGIWFLFLNITTIMSFCDFGLSPTLSREIGFTSSKLNRPVLISNLYHAVKIFINAISLIALLLLLCFGYFYLSHSKIIFAFAVLAVGIMIQLQANPKLAVIYGLGKVTAERTIRAIGPACGILIMAILIIKLHWGLYGFVTGYLCQTLLIYLLSQIMLHQNIALTKSTLSLLTTGKKLLEPSLQWTIMAIGGTLIFQVSNFIIAYFLGIQHVAQFAVLLQIFTLITVLSSVISYAITPLVAQAQGENNPEKIHRFFATSVQTSTLIAIALAVFIYFFIAAISKVWLGPNFIIEKNALIILLIAAVLEAHHISCASVTMATGYVKFAIIAMIAGILNLILSFIFIYNWGIVGAAMAIFSAQLLTNNWYVVLISLKKLRYPMKQYLTRIAGPLLLFAAYITLLCLASKYFIQTPNAYYQVLTAILFGCIGVSSGLWFFYKTKILEPV
jgi:O-antigen/teichoic acid export membrane protein